MEITKWQDQCSRGYVRTLGRFEVIPSCENALIVEAVLGRYFTQLEVAL